MKLEFSGQIFEKYSNINLMKILPVEAELFHADGRKDVMTDMEKLIVVLRNFPNEPKNTHWTLCGYNERGRSGFSVINDKEPALC